LVVSLHLRFRILNELLARGQNLDKNLKILAKLHLRLCKIIKIVNKIYSIPLALAVMSSLNQFTFALYEDISITVLGRSNYNHLGFCMLINAFNLFTVMLTIFVLILINKTVGEGHRTLELVNDEILMDRGRNLKMLRIFKIQLIENEVTFSCGLFNLDSRGVVMFVSGILSNLVILLQFDAKIVQKINSAII
jgi:7tm Chemosensory receptor